MRHSSGAFPAIYEGWRYRFIHGFADSVEVDRWQSTDVEGTPLAKTIEIRNAAFDIDIPSTIDELQAVVMPNLPWAEDHFQERISGMPMNPGFEYQNWPWYKGNVEKHQTQSQERFSHTYMERFWPKYADARLYQIHVDAPPGTEAEAIPHQGIRFAYGDLKDVVELLMREPLTRQAYLPVWFPEDTGVVHGERVPCTLGYHFMIRNQRLYCNYFSRSCDFVRYFRDDVYLACRLAQWIRQALNFRVPDDQNVSMGQLEMFMSSLHIFEGDLPKLRREANGS